MSPLPRPSYARCPVCGEQRQTVEFPHAGGACVPCLRGDRRVNHARDSLTAFVMTLATVAVFSFVAGWVARLLLVR